MWGDWEVLTVLDLVGGGLGVQPKDGATEMLGGITTSLGGALFDFGGRVGLVGLTNTRVVVGGLRALGEVTCDEGGRFLGARGGLTTTLALGDATTSTTKQPLVEVSRAATRSHAITFNGRPLTGVPEGGVELTLGSTLGAGSTLGLTHDASVFTPDAIACRTVVNELWS